MSDQARTELAPSGVLRAAVNMGNFLLVTGRTLDGDPDGVSPDMARAIAVRLGVPLEIVPFDSPGEISDAVGTDVWDICLIGAEPQRAEKTHSAQPMQKSRRPTSSPRALTSR